MRAKGEIFSYTFVYVFKIFANLINYYCKHFVKKDKNIPKCNTYKLLQIEICVYIRVCILPTVRVTSLKFYTRS